MRAPRSSMAAVGALLLALAFAVPSPSAGAAEVAPRSVRGVLVLRAGLASGDAACAGTGLYHDVQRGTPVVVRDGSGSVLARTGLRRGRNHDGDCWFAFTVRRLPIATVYAFKIGKAGSVYQASYDRAGLVRAGDDLRFEI